MADKSPKKTGKPTKLTTKEKQDRKKAKKNASETVIIPPSGSR